MRLFLAVDIPDKVKEQLEQQLYEFKKQYPGFEWVNPENYHITIHFFGEKYNANEIGKKIKDLLWDKTEFFLYSFGLDVFANHKLHIYLTFRREKKIEELAERIKGNFDLNLENDRKYIPHLTLARAKRSSKQQYFVLKKRLQNLDVDISFSVKKVVLFQSVIEGKQPVYKRLSSFKLLSD